MEIGARKMHWFGCLQAQETQKKIDGQYNSTFSGRKVRVEEGSKMFNVGKMDEAAFAQLGKDEPKVCLVFRCLVNTWDCWSVCHQLLLPLGFTALVIEHCFYQLVI